MSVNKKKTTDMTNGGVAKTLLLFALPLFAGSIFQQLYNTADFMFVGNLIGKNAAAAVGAGSILVTCLIGLFTGISVGTGVVISQYIGAGDREEAQKIGHTAIAFSFILGIIMTIAGEVVARFVLILLHTPENILPEAIAYIRLYFLGMLPMIIYNVGSGILRACGDSKSPFYILAAGGFLNVLADWMMIGVFRLGVQGAALATTISQSFSAIGILWFLLKGNEHFQMRWKKIGVDAGALKKILMNGLPAGIQSMVITLSNMVVQYHINGFGSDSVAAFSTYYKLENFTYMPVLAFGQAMTTFAGQNYGAGKIDRVKKGAVIGTVMSGTVVAAAACFLLAIGHTSIGWFVKEEEVIQIGISIISVTFPFYWLNSFIEILSGTIRGMGKSLASMIIILLTLCGFRVLLLTILDGRFHDIRYLAAAYPLSWAAAVICLFAALCVLMKKEK
ncbi:MAG: MATE family efflux transporter [Muricoprocola sp.]